MTGTHNAKIGRDTVPIVFNEQKGHAIPENTDVNKSLFRRMAHAK
jgi:hypothetical protein